MKLHTAHPTRRPKFLGPFRVDLVNLDMPSASAGYGTGKTLADAQRDALAKARERDSQAFLSDNGLEVWYNGGSET